VTDKVEALVLKFVERIFVHTSTLVVDEVRQGSANCIAAVSGGFPRLAEHSRQLVRLLSELQRYKHNINAGVKSMTHRSLIDLMNRNSSRFSVFFAIDLLDLNPVKPNQQNHPVGGLLGYSLVGRNPNGLSIESETS